MRRRLQRPWARQKVWVCRPIIDLQLRNTIERRRLGQLKKTACNVVHEKLSHFGYLAERHTGLTLLKSRKVGVVLGARLRCCQYASLTTATDLIVEAAFQGSPGRVND